MKTLEFELTTGDKNSGTVLVPDLPDLRFPVFIYCHGWGSNRDSIIPGLSKILEERGIACVSFDFFGCGKTGGDNRGMTYARWAQNLAEVYAWVESQPWANPTKIGCLGTSSGSTAVLRFALTQPRLNFVISNATCLSAHFSMPNGPGKLLADNFETLASGGQVKAMGTEFKLPFFLDILGAQPILFVREIPCPVFFLEGTADNPYRRSDGWLGFLLRSGNNLAAKHLEIEGGDHGLHNRSEEANRRIVEFMEEQKFLA